MLHSFIYSFWSLEIHILKLFFPESQGLWNYNSKMKADNIIQSRDFKKDAKHCAITELREKMKWHLPFLYFFFSLLSFLLGLLLLCSSLFSFIVLLYFHFFCAKTDLAGLHNQVRLWSPIEPHIVDQVQAVGLLDTLLRVDVRANKMADGFIRILNLHLWKYG